MFVIFFRTKTRNWSLFHYYSVSVQYFNLLFSTLSAPHMTFIELIIDVWSLVPVNINIYIYTQAFPRCFVNINWQTMNIMLACLVFEWMGRLLKTKLMKNKHYPSCAINLKIFYLKFINTVDRNSTWDGGNDVSWKLLAI